MSVKRFKFVSPGVFVNEIDNSQLPKISDRVGPVIVGRMERGPSMRPVTVKSQAEFVEMFGQPIPGGKSGDVWREGNYQAPTYAGYAAMAYLRNNSPATIVRLLGSEHENASATGKAGWSVDKEAYGLFVWDANTSTLTAEVTGTLAAVWYFDAGVVCLSGKSHIDSAQSEATGLAIRSVGANHEFKATIYEDDSAATKVLETTFNFNKNSDKYIRKVFNTNPSLLEAGTISSANSRKYFLGQTFEDSLGDYLTSGNAAEATVGMIVKLTDDTKSFANFNLTGGSQNATTGWVISQQLGDDTANFDPKASPPTGCNRLFRLNAMDAGQWESSNLKISIEDIRYSHTEADNPYGSFTVSVRKANDNDGRPVYLERFSNCNLNPQSSNYIKRKIGDMTLEWDEGERRYKHVGDYANNSKFVVCEVNADLDNASLDPLLIPFGFQGPPQLKPVLNNMASPTAAEIRNAGTADTVMFSYTSMLKQGGTTNQFDFRNTNLKLDFPKARCRTSSDDGALSNRSAAYFGVDTLESGSQKQTNRGWGDLMYTLPDNVGGAFYDISYAVSLDDVILDGGTTTWTDTGVATTMARAAGTAYSVKGPGGSDGNYKEVLDAGIDQFTMPLHGGFDGLDIQTLDPFSPDRNIGTTDKTSYEYYSIRKAIDTCADAEVVEMNIMCVPGITTNGINVHLVNVAENRADCLAILDLDGGYSPRANRLSSEDTFSAYGGTVNATLLNLKTLALNSSYACAYYPWVQIRDQDADAVLWVPPSVVALGTMGSSEAKSEIWFAPAGFTRGGLTEGSAGVPVTGVRDRLTSKQRDQLYQQSVNPIATFPAEGIVIFGQKTMQITPSALDRINVRRLMIFVKKEISRMAATVLFDQNIDATWNRFLGRVNPFLRSVQTRLGLTAFKVILDESTTTAELVDRNIMYAKILLKPARAIEFIAIDFVITNSGASFED